eukprot:scaffold416_cov329-Pavlova_lutheri.AAC.8
MPPGRFPLVWRWLPSFFLGLRPAYGRDSSLRGLSRIVPNDVLAGATGGATPLLSGGRRRNATDRCGLARARGIRFAIQVGVVLLEPASVRIVHEQEHHFDGSISLTWRGRVGGGTNVPNRIAKSKPFLVLGCPRSACRRLGATAHTHRT